MKIAILSRTPHVYSTRRLKEAARLRGHDVQVLDTLRFSLSVEGRNPRLFYGRRKLPAYDGVIPRIGASVTFFGTAVVRQFEQMGVFTLNTSHAISVSRDKLRSLQALSRHSIGLPPTQFVRDREHVLAAIGRVGGTPVIIKVLEGTQGIGVILAESDKVAEAIVETLQGAKQNVLIQKFVAESRGKDVRALVVGDRVVAAMRRTAKAGEFRSNVHRGGSTTGLKLDEEYERTAVHAAQILGLRVAGVDMLETSQGPQVLEVNSSPGLGGIEAASGTDVAGEIIAHLEEQVQFPEIDLRQKLTLKSGYGVAEFTITPESDLIGKTIAESGLRDRDVIVLNISRQGLVIPNPKGSRELMLGDSLLCFGKLITLRTLVPQVKPRTRKTRRS
jgi:ribosomal protein S6--L-glutamate ligase